MEIVEKLLGLQKQATTEQSHFYVASCITEAIQEIIALRHRLDAQEPSVQGDAEHRACGLFGVPCDLCIHKDVCKFRTP